MRKKKTEDKLLKPESKTGVSTGGSKFFDKITALVEQARIYVGHTADLTMCVTYFKIGCMIVEEEQGGEARAEYGRGLIKELSRFSVFDGLQKMQERGSLSGKRTAAKEVWFS